MGLSGPQDAPEALSFSAKYFTNEICLISSWSQGWEKIVSTSLFLVQ